MITSWYITQITASYLEVNPLEQNKNIDSGVKSKIGFPGNSRTEIYNEDFLY